MKLKNNWYIVLVIIILSLLIIYRPKKQILETVKPIKPALLTCVTNNYYEKYYIDMNDYNDFTFIVYHLYSINSNTTKCILEENK